MRSILFLLTTVMLLTGCDSESLQENDLPISTWAVVIGDYSLDQLDGDAFELRAARIEGTDLVVDVAYSGGCAEHAFSGFTPEVNLTIYPPQITVFVVHEGNGDMCEAYLSESVNLDMTSLLDTFGDEFQLTVSPVNSGSDHIVLHEGS